MFPDSQIKRTTQPASLRLAILFVGCSFVFFSDSLTIQCVCGDESSDHRFEFVAKTDRLVISHAGRRVADFVFDDSRILRPYFSNVCAPGEIPVTRRHPPVKGKDATDHATMHPGIWYGFGEISGVDFWRNKGRIQHIRFTREPTVNENMLSFETLSHLLAPDRAKLAEMESRIQISQEQGGWLILWEAEFQSDDREITFGDQEEMGFGARVATPLTEQNGGAITNSAGQASAGKTWGQPAKWCDYSGKVGGTPAGITLLADPENFRPSWWHNRDYGVFVANPFGRAAMKQGEKSTVRVEKGQTFRLRFGAFTHSGSRVNPAETYRVFLKHLQDGSQIPTK